MRTKAALQPDREKVAQDRIASPRLRQARLVISVPPTHVKVTVSLDDELPPDRLNVPLVVVAGDHDIKAATDRDEGEPFETNVSLQGGGRTTTVPAIPVTPGAKMKRRVGLIVAGGVLMGVGVAAGVGTAYLATNNGEPGPTIGLGVLTLASLAVGIPLFAVGFKKRAVVDNRALLIPPSPIPDFAVGAGSASATWHF